MLWNYHIISFFPNMIHFYKRKVWCITVASKSYGSYFIFLKFNQLLFKYKLTATYTITFTKCDQRVSHNYQLDSNLNIIGSHKHNTQSCDWYKFAKIYNMQIIDEIKVIFWTWRLYSTTTVTTKPHSTQRQRFAINTDRTYTLIYAKAYAYR